MSPGVCTRTGCRRPVAGPWPDLCPEHGAKLDELCAGAKMPTEMVEFLKMLAAENALRRLLAEATDA